MSSEVIHESKDERQTDPVSESPELTQHVSQQEDTQDELRSQALTAETTTLPEGYYLSWRFIGTFAGISLSLTSTNWAFEASAACLVLINQDIGPSDNYYLYSIVWVIAQPISQLIFGRNSDIFGRRNFALGANILGIIGGIIACTAQSVNQLIAANVILDLSSGIPASFHLLAGELLSNKLKFIGTLIVILPNVLATGFGPYLGQRLGILASWRWIFYIYIIMMGTRSFLSATCKDLI
jgi:MFS family permease